MVLPLVVLAAKFEVRRPTPRRAGTDLTRSRRRKKLDRQLEEARKDSELQQVNTVEMDVEQTQDHPMTGGASSSSKPATSGQETVPVASPSSHEVQTEIVEQSGGRRPLAEGDESSSKRVSPASMLLFDENDMSHWQDSIWEAHSSNLNNDRQGPEDIMDHREQPNTDIPGVWRCPS